MRERRTREPSPTVVVQRTDSVSLEHVGPITRYSFTVDGQPKVHFTTTPGYAFQYGYQKVQSDRSLLTSPSILRSVHELGFADGEALVAAESKQLADVLKKPEPYDYKPANSIASMVSRLIRSEALRLLFDEAFVPEDTGN